VAARRRKESGTTKDHIEKDRGKGRQQGRDEEVSQLGQSQGH